MATDTVYLGHDNVIRKLFLEEKEPVDLSSVSKMTLSLAGITIESDNGPDDLIRWGGGLQTGEVVLSLGSEARLKARPAPYDAVFVVYDGSHANGIVWGSIKILVKAEVEVDSNP